MRESPEKDIQSAPDLPALLESAWRYWWLCLVVGVVLAVVGMSAGQLIPAQYKATARLRLSGPQGVVDQPHESSNAQREFRHTQKELLHMPHVIQRALEADEVRELEEFDSSSDSIEEVAELVQVELPRSSEIMKVEISHDQAETAYLLVNAVVEAYLEEVQRADTEERERRLSTLERLQAQAEERLGNSWHELQVLAKQIGSGDPATLSLQAQAEIENYRAYSRRLREIRTEKREAERQIRAIRDNPELLAEEMPEDASMHSVKFAMFSAKLKRERALMNLGEQHPGARVAKQEEDLLREYYQKAITEEPTEPQSRTEKLLAEPLSTIARLQHEESALKSIVAEIEDRLDVLGGDNVSKLEILRSEVRRTERLSDRLWQARESLQVERHANQRVQLVSYASIPTKKDASKRRKLSLMLACAGFGFAFAAVALVEFSTGRLHSRRDVVARSAMEVVGTGKALSDDFRSASLQSRHGASFQHLDMLVAQLLNEPRAQQARTILMTSAANRSERGYLSEHVAAALARTGKNTILINLDLREHLSGDETGESKSTGITEFLLSSGEKKLVCHRVDGIAGLDIVDAGGETENPLACLSSSLLAELLCTVRNTYDFVVLDVAAVTAHPDALHVGRHGDAAIICVRKNRTKGSKLREARERLESLGIPVFGLMTK